MPRNEEKVVIENVFWKCVLPLLERLFMVFAVCYKGSVIQVLQEQVRLSARQNWPKVPSSLRFICTSRWCPHAVSHSYFYNVYSTLRRKAVKGNSYDEHRNDDLTVHHSLSSAFFIVCRRSFQVIEKRYSLYLSGTCLCLQLLGNIQETAHQKPALFNKVLTNTIEVIVEGVAESQPKPNVT